MMSKTRSALYKTARIMGDIESLSSPSKFFKRQVRKATYRRTNGLLSKLLRSLMK